MRSLRRSATTFCESAAVRFTHSAAPQSVAQLHARRNRAIAAAILSRAGCGFNPYSQAARERLPGCFGTAHRSRPVWAERQLGQSSHPRDQLEVHH
jgi:hypothetical protein